MNELLNDLLATRLRLDTPPEQATLVFFLLTLFFFLLAWLRVRTPDAAQRLPLRRIPGLHVLRSFMGRVAVDEAGQSQIAPRTQIEEIPEAGVSEAVSLTPLTGEASTEEAGESTGGVPIHISPGAGGLNNMTTAETMAGLSYLDMLTASRAHADAPLIVTSGDGLTYVATAGMVNRVAAEGNPEVIREAQLVAPDPLAYAVGVGDIVTQDVPAASIVIGSLGDEYMLLGEPTARRGNSIAQVIGSTQPRTIAASLLTADFTLMAEEIFAGRAYLTRARMQVASLQAQDWLRLALVIGIVGVMILNLTSGR